MKRVISFVLVLALVLGSFSMAFAAPLNDVDGSDNETAITVVNDLGIITGYSDGSFKPEQLVTRAEYAAMIVRALNIPESALAGYTSTTFKDTAGYGWAVKYLAFCEDKGIMLGDGQGNAMPGRTINTNEAMTMALRAIGLTNNSAILVGNWPANYVTVAKNNDLYEDVDAAVNVTREMAAQIIYNLLTVPGFVVNADGDTTQNAPRLITGLTDGQRTGLVYYTTASLIPLADYVGAYGTVYVNDDSDIVAIDVESTFLKGEFDNTNGLVFTSDDVDYNVTGWTSVSGIINAAVITDEALSVPEALAMGSVTVAADVVGKTITKVYSVSDWISTADAMVGEDVQDEITDDTPALLSVGFYENKDQEIDENAFQLLGVSSLDKIAEDNIVYVYAYGNNAANDIVKIEVGTKTVEGKVTKTYKDSDGYDVAVLDGNDYWSAGPTLAVGEEGTAYLDYAGDVYYWDVTDATADNYAVVSDTVDKVGRDNTIILFDKNGTEKEYTLTSDVDNATTAGFVVGDIVTFSLDKNGKLEEINKVAGYNDRNLSGTIADDGSVIGTNVVADGIVVFAYDGSGFAIEKVANFDTEATIANITHGAVLDGTKIKALVIDDSILGGSEASYGIVTKNDIFATDADGDTVQALNIFIDGKEMKDVLTTKTTQHYTKTTTGAGTLVEIKIDADGVITDIAAPAATSVTYTAVTVTNVTTGVAIDGKIVTIDKANSYRVGDSAVLYIYDADNGWEAKTALSALKKNANIVFYDTDSDTVGYEVVMAW